jgi:hypothetical protein
LDGSRLLAPLKTWEVARPRARWFVAAGSFALHAGVLTAIVFGGLALDSAIHRKGQVVRIDSAAINADVKPRLEVRLINPVTQLALAQVQEQSSAGPIASNSAKQASSIPVKPKKVQLVEDASEQGVEANARPLTSLMIAADLIPPQISRLKARIWIDATGLAARVELLTKLDDEYAEKLIIEAILDAIYIPAEKDGQTVASVAVLEFGRGEAEYAVPLFNASSVVTPTSAH